MQGVALVVFVGQALVGQMLLGKILRDALHALEERRGEAARDGAVYQQQAFAGVWSMSTILSALRHRPAQPLRKMRCPQKRVLKVLPWLRHGGGEGLSRDKTI